MQPTLNLFDHLLERGRRMQQLGRLSEALHTLTRLSRFPDLPADVSEETHVRLARLCLERRRYARARRHLGIALRLRPQSARYHYLMAVACRADDRGDLPRALTHYRRAIELAPDQPRNRSEYGLLCLRLGQTEEGIDQLRQAAEQAPGHANTIDRLVRGLCQAGRCEEARTELQMALFRNPGSVTLRRLWADFQFRQVRRAQEVAALDESPSDEGPCLLPFVRPGQECEPPGAAEAEATDTQRTDEPEHLAGPTRPRLLRRPDQRRVR
jgi:tetratricopeptide (TPR) repeat protein